MPHAGKPRIFVVDDERVIATTMALILDGTGFAAEAFLSPLDALKAAETRCPDIMISDVIMPELNGIDLGIQFKAMHPKCRVLLFSGHATTTDIMLDAKSSGHHFDLLAKPIPPQELISAIRKMVPPN